MIESADEFARLRWSDDPAEYGRAAHEPAPLEVWQDVIARFPELRQWVAHNKTVPHEILAELATDPDASVRYFVAMKRKLALELQLRLATDPDDSVRAGIANNAKASRAALELLAEDPWHVIAERARERLAAGRFV